MVQFDGIDTLDRAHRTHVPQGFGSERTEERQAAPARLEVSLRSHPLVSEKIH
jgi:hypothetical protein